MTKRKNLIIAIKDFSPPFIASREAARIITQELIKQLSASEDREAFLDFRSIVFVSRSFADEMLDSIEALRERSVRIKVKNANLSICKMLDLVKNKRQKILRRLKTN